MRIPRLPFIKICCISSPEEAALAISAGADAIGLVSAMPSGPGVIDDQAIGEIAAAVPPPIATFLLTSRRTADAIIDQHRRCRTTTIQIVDRVESAELRKLRGSLPGIKLVQVIHVTDDESVEEARSVSGMVDALLLDSGNRTLPVKELGGTGRTHDWRLSRSIRDEASVPVFLAGGLSAGSIVEATRTVEPLGVDVCSGVRTKGRLDASKLREFMDALAGGRRGRPT